MKIHYGSLLALLLALSAGCTNKTAVPTTIPEKNDEVKENLQVLPAPPVPPEQMVILEAPFESITGTNGTKSAEIKIVILIEEQGRTIESHVVIWQDNILLPESEHIPVEEVVKLAAAIEAAAKKEAFQRVRIGRISVSRSRPENGQAVKIDGEGILGVLHLAVAIEDADKCSKALRSAIGVNARLMRSIKLDAAKEKAIDDSEVGVRPTQGISVVTALGTISAPGKGSDPELHKLFPALGVGPEVKMKLRFSANEKEVSSFIDIPFFGLTLTGISGFNASLASELADAVAAAAAAISEKRAFKERVISRMRIETHESGDEMAVGVTGSGPIALRFDMTPKMAEQFVENLRKAPGVHSWVKNTIDFDAILKE